MLGFHNQENKELLWVKTEVSVQNQEEIISRGITSDQFNGLLLELCNSIGTEKCRDQRQTNSDAVGDEMHRRDGQRSTECLQYFCNFMLHLTADVLHNLETTDIHTNHIGYIGNRRNQFFLCGVQKKSPPISRQITTFRINCQMIFTVK